MWLGAAAGWGRSLSSLSSAVVVISITAYSHLRFSMRCPERTQTHCNNSLLNLIEQMNATSCGDNYCNVAKVVRTIIYGKLTLVDRADAPTGTQCLVARSSEKQQDVGENEQRCETSRMKEHLPGRGRSLEAVECRCRRKHR